MTVSVECCERLLEGLAGKDPQSTAGVSPFWYWLGPSYLFPAADDFWLRRAEHCMLPSFAFDRLDGYCRAHSWGVMYSSRAEAMAALERVRHSLTPITTSPESRPVGVPMSETSGIESGGDKAVVTFEQVWGEIERLREVCARHRKNGVRITQLQPRLQSCQVIAEAVELQAEVLSPPYDGRRDAILREAADTVVVLLHLLIQHGIESDELLPACLKSLSEHWDVSETRPEGG